jgi:putative ABC transport system permease protein
VEFTFLDADFENQFFKEKLLNNLSFWITVIAVIISSFGLLGLTMFNAEKRTKEVGIRKLLGASTQQILRLVLFDLLKPTFISLIISLPVAYFIMEKFLDKYVYRIEINTLDFFFVSVAVILLLLATTLQTCLNIVRKNPVDAIKVE